MSFLKISISDPTNTEQIEAAIALLQGLLSDEAPVAKKVKAAPVTEVKKGKVATGKKTPVIEDFDGEDEDNEEDEGNEEETHTIESVRKLAASKANDTTKPKIRAKLKALGAETITDLDPKKYNAFVDFLNGLKG